MNPLELRLHRRMLLIVITALITMTLLVSPATAEPIRVDFINYNIACSFVDVNVWVSEGGIIHLRDRVYQSVIISADDYYHGNGGIIGNANIIDPATGIGTYFGTLDIHPTAYPDGYWAGHWNMQITENGFQGIARLKGYGSLEGMLSFGSLTPLPPTVLADFAPYCGGNQPVAGTYVVGYYLIPGGE